MADNKSPIESAKVPQTLSSEQVAAEAEGGTVDMHFPKEVHLTRDDHAKIVFKAGIQPVPVDLKDHFWLKANGVKPAAASTRNEVDALARAEEERRVAEAQARAEAQAKAEAEEKANASRKGK